MLRNAILGLLLTAPVSAAQVDDLGQIDFPNSGAESAQPPFLRGALLLHSFEYDDAAEAFRAAQAADPGFVLAYWGEALTYWHPIWGREDREAARAVLERLGATREERLGKAPTERERGYLETVEILWADGDVDERIAGYSRALAALSERYPDDLEAAAFYALSLLGLSFGERDVPAYMRSAGVAEVVYARNPRHPGALHYLIHAYDDPVHAPLGLRMANTYARVAPAAAHALHMPSHIYVALGRWGESAASNEASFAAADARRELKDLSVEARGFHSLHWLAYSYLQQGRFQEARELLAEMERDARSSGSKRTRYHLTAMRATYLACAGDDGTVWEMECDTSDLRLVAVAGSLLATGLVAYRRRDDVETLRSAHGALRERLGEPLASYGPPPSFVDCCRPADGDNSDERSPGRLSAHAMEHELAALSALEDGDAEGALALLSRATEAEVAAGFNFGPPVVVKPAHELLGEVLLQLDRAVAARAAFEAALTRNPRRTSSLLGLARAARAADDDEAARAAYEELVRILHGADSDLPALAEVRDFLAAPRR